MISAARKAFAICNLFIIYNFYEQLETIVNENNLSPDQIWNCN